MSCLKMQGLNYNVRINEIEEFFSEFKPIPNSIKLGLNNEGRRNGCGVVAFPSAEMASKA